MDRDFIYQCIPDSSRNLVTLVMRGSIIIMGYENQ